MIDWKRIRVGALGEQPKSVLPPRVKMPVLSLALQKFTKRAEEPDANAKELGALIEADAGLTCELLRYVNSASTGLKVRASSAQQAISALGIRESKLFLISTGVKQAQRNIESKLINIPNFAIANLERALFAREVAKLLKADAELAFSAAMLQDFVLPVVSNQMFPTYLDFSKAQQESSVDLVTLEQKKFQWDHAVAAAQVMFGWGFPDDLICCVVNHHAGLGILKNAQLGKSAVAAVAIAGLVPEPMQQVPKGLDQLVRLDSAWPDFCLLDMAKTVQQQFEEMSPGARNPFPLLKRCEKACSSAV